MSADHARLHELIGAQENWGLSGIDVPVASAAVQSRQWSDHVRMRMHDDNRWLAQALTDLPGLELWPNENVHFQYGWTDQPEDLADGLARQGIGVRPLGAAHGVRPGALRIVAPRVEERPRFAAALSAMREEALCAGIRA